MCTFEALGVTGKVDLKADMFSKTEKSSRKCLVIKLV